MGSEGEVGGAAVLIDASELDESDDQEDEMLSALLGEQAVPVETEVEQPAEVHESEFVQAWDRDMRAFLAR